ncbi:MAG: hypothetical protein V4507_04725 [Verrucomicrobiota bacterium]
MFKKPSLDEIEELLTPLRKNVFYSGNSDYQRLHRAGSNYRGMSGIFAFQIFAISTPFGEGGWRLVGDLFCLTVIVWFWFLGGKYHRACEVMEEASPISLDDVRKKSVSKINS